MFIRPDNANQNDTAIIFSYIKIKIMNKIYTLLTAMLIGISTSTFATQVDCSYTSITSNITTNTTLSAGTLYRMEGCIHVTNGHTLTIPAGTTVMFEKSVDAALIIDKGATLNVNGTSGSPVIFTCDQTPTTKNYGDWSGVIIEGNASNNVSGGSVSVSGRTCSSLSGGGSTDADNSGSITYLRIEYAKYGMTLLSVGSGTTMNNIQTAFIANHAFEFYGGTVKAKNLISYNAKGNDFIFEYGNRSLLQFALSIRLDVSNAHLASGSNAIMIANDGSGSTNTPLTHPVISDATFIGPLYCGAGPISSDYKNAVLFQLNANGGVYNSFLSGWPTGMRMQDLSTLNNADVNYTLNFAENSFSSNTTDYSNNSTWPANCATDLNDWVTDGQGPFASCAQLNNQLPSYTTGYSSTICTTYTSTVVPSFILSNSTALNQVDYSATDLQNAFFTTTGTRYHGGFNKSTDWTTGWTNWDPANFNPCPQNKMSSTTAINGLTVENLAGLQLAPNPSNGTTYALFNAAADGNISISIVDNAGRVLRTSESIITKGDQHISVDTKGLAAGLYIIQVQSANSSMHAHLLVE
ncbi:MAG: hypothetical protein BGO69_05445 [Bacteroidetes bacterium 46-16]|nr:MAG: hypothetical protein BGO69_05445 [Bacteroidetes bacterium 46-16]